jgi:hypothetical protein
MNDVFDRTRVKPAIRVLPAEIEASAYVARRLAIARARAAIGAHGHRRRPRNAQTRRALARKGAG